MSHQINSMTSLLANSLFRFFALIPHLQWLPQTSRRHFFERVWSALSDQLVYDDGEAVDISLLRAGRWRVDLPQQLRGSPLSACNRQFAFAQIVFAGRLAS